MRERGERLCPANAHISGERQEGGCRPWARGGWSQGDSPHPFAPAQAICFNHQHIFFLPGVYRYILKIISGPFPLQCLSLWAGWFPSLAGPTATLSVQSRRWHLGLVWHPGVPRAGSSWLPLCPFSPPLDSMTLSYCFAKHYLDFNAFKRLLRKMPMHFLKHKTHFWS